MLWLLILNNVFYHVLFLFVTVVLSVAVPIALLVRPCSIVVSPPVDTWADITVPGFTQPWRVHSILMGWDPKITDSRPHMLLIHGTGSTARVWTFLEKTFGQKYRLTAVDLPGFGHSDTPPIRSDVNAMYAQFFTAYAEHYHMDQIVVVGHSFGAYLALYWATVSPQRISKLILADCIGILPIQGRWGAFWGTFFKLSPLQRLFRFLGPCGAALLPAAVRDEYAILSHPEAVGDSIVAQFITKNWFTGRTFWNTPLFDRLLTLKMPLAFIYGETDTITPAHQGRALVQILNPAIPVLEIPNAGHNVSDKLAMYLEKAIDNAQPVHTLQYRSLDLRPFASSFSFYDTRQNYLALYDKILEHARAHRG